MKGFTLVEVMVVSGIIILIAGIMLLFGPSGQREIALTRSAEKLAANLERAKALALQTRSFAGGIPCGYGLFFSTATTSYTLYADTPPGASLCTSQVAAAIKRNPDGSEDQEVIPLERDIVISALTPSASGELYVVFSPPRPQVRLHPVGTGAEIKLQISGSSSSKTVIVEESGGIYIQ